MLSTWTEETVPTVTVGTGTGTGGAERPLSACTCTLALRAAPILTLEGRTDSDK